MAKYLSELDSADRQGIAEVAEARTTRLREKVEHYVTNVGTSDTALIHALDVATGKEIYQQSAKSYIWASLGFAGDAFVVGQFNGTVEGRDLKSGDLLWSLTTEAPKKNAGWVLNAYVGFNGPLIYRSNWIEEPAEAMPRQCNVGSFVVSPTIANGVIYIGSTDGKVYAIE